MVDGFQQSVDLNENEGWGLIVVGLNNHRVGWVALQDEARTEARDALAQLKQCGVRRFAMVSGDRQPVAA